MNRKTFQEVIKEIKKDEVWESFSYIIKHTGNIFQICAKGKSGDTMAVGVDELFDLVETYNIREAFNLMKKDPHTQFVEGSRYTCLENPNVEYRYNASKGMYQTCVIYSWIPIEVLSIKELTGRWVRLN